MSKKYPALHLRYASEMRTLSVERSLFSYSTVKVRISNAYLNCRFTTNSNALLIAFENRVIK